MNVDGVQKIDALRIGTFCKKNVRTSETSCQYSIEISSIHFSGGCEKQENKSSRQKQTSVLQKNCRSLVVNEMNSRKPFLFIDHLGL